MITGLVTLGGVSLDDNLVLSGIEQNADSAYSVRELLGGPVVIQMDARSVGAELSLISPFNGSSRQGQYCQYQIDQLKAIAKLLQPVSLVHPRGTFTVYILDFDVTEREQNEEPHINKKYHGVITLQEA